MSDPRPPAISVVVAASESPGAVARLLGAVPPADDVEWVVASPADWPEAPGPAAWVRGAPGASVPELRRLGLDRAGGDLIVWTEDSVVPAPGWLDGWRAAFADPGTLAAGGPVGAAMGDRLIDRAVFSCEYAPFAPVGWGPEFPPGRLPGNNFAARRSLADRLGPGPVDEGAVARLAGKNAAWSAGATVFHVRRYGLAEAVRDRLRFGHDYGRDRMAGRPFAWRAAGVVAGPLILASQAARLILTVCRRGRDLGPTVEALPVTLGLLTAWSAGEWLGWAGTALRPRASHR